MATLYVIATPIGNLGDFSDRGKEIVGSVSLLLCEDTRVTRKLLNAFQIDVQTRSFHQHSSQRVYQEVLERIQAGEDVGLVTDAGTPAISDPGGKLIQHLLSSAPETDIRPIPGPSAMTAALSICGFPTDSFRFLGFPPNKKGRGRYFEEVCSTSETTVFYESPHRILKTMEALAERQPDRLLLVARELTKLHETIYRGTVLDVFNQLQSATIKGEFVLVLAPNT